MRDACAQTQRIFFSVERRLSWVSYYQKRRVLYHLLLELVDGLVVEQFWALFEFLLLLWLARSALVHNDLYIDLLHQAHRVNGEVKLGNQLAHAEPALDAMQIEVQLKRDKQREGKPELCFHVILKFLDCLQLTLEICELLLQLSMKEIQLLIKHGDWTLRALQEIFIDGGCNYLLLLMATNNNKKTITLQQANCHSKF